MKKILVVVAVAVVAVGGWRMRGSTAPAPTESKLAYDRLWIDHLPRNDRDTINVFVAFTEHSMGVFQATSSWQGTYEGFRFEARGDELRAVYPQTGDKDKIRVRARACHERGMDFCLEIEGASRGVKRYYSLEGWEIESRERADAIVHSLY